MNESLSEAHRTLAEEIAPLTPGFDLLSDHVIITDVDGHVLYMNAAAEKKTGYSKEEVIGKNGGKIWGGLMEKEFYTALWESIKTHKQTYVGEVKNRAKDGTEYWAELRITPVLDNDGNIQCFIGIEPDVTARKEADEKLNATKDKLFHFLAEREVRMMELKKQLRSSQD